MRRWLPLLFSLAAPGWLAAQQPGVQVLAAQMDGSRVIEAQTQSAVLRDYLESWSSLGAALAQNQPALLDLDFAGTARSKLGDTINQQVAAGIRTEYTNLTHAITFVFYSQEGTSIELLDTVSYNEQIRSADHVLVSQPVTARYLVVLTPSQVRWQVRLMQASAPAGR